MTQEPKQWPMKQASIRDPRPAFMRSLAELGSLLGVAVPSEPYNGREEYWAAKEPVLDALDTRRPLAEEYFAPLMRVAIHDPNPSFNRYFIEPAIVDFGRRRVWLALIDVMCNGPDGDRPGAADAFYWAAGGRIRDREGVIVPMENRPAGIDEITDLYGQWEEACLRAFLGTDDIDVRRSIAFILPLKAPEDFEDGLGDLVAEVIRIAEGWPQSGAG